MKKLIKKLLVGVREVLALLVCPLANGGSTQRERNKE
jgi:hypothetical protein